MGLFFFLICLSLSNYSFSTFYLKRGCSTSSFEFKKTSFKIWLCHCLGLWGMWAESWSPRSTCPQMYHVLKMPTLHPVKEWEQYSKGRECSAVPAPSSAWLQGLTWLGWRGNEERTDTRPYRKVEISELGSLLKELQHPGNSVCLLYTFEQGGTFIMYR